VERGCGDAGAARLGDKSTGESGDETDKRVLEDGGNAAVSSAGR
jgi:hypothetical protein